MMRQLWAADHAMWVVGIRMELRKGKNLDQIQALLEYTYPGKDFERFMHIWKKFHPEGGIILRDACKARVMGEAVKTANTDMNWRVR